LNDQTVTLVARSRLSTSLDHARPRLFRGHCRHPPSHVAVIPVDDDPLEALRAEFADVEQTAAELRADARDAALDGAGR
jgi:hypothetical protein